jgi:predicted house-cleaning noncanonical NTP pyrophosphatase (MazG superfamily)
MTKIFHRKLVRDKIPEIIKSSGDTCLAITLDNSKFELELKKKLIEESVEVMESSKEELTGELADVLEIIYSLIDLNKIKIEDVESQRKSKKEKRGGFDKRIFLEWSDKKD